MLDVQYEQITRFENRIGGQSRVLVMHNQKKLSYNEIIPGAPQRSMKLNADY